MFHQRTRKHNRRKQTPMMRHRIWVNSQSQNNNKQTASQPRTEKGKGLIQSLNKVIQQPTEVNIKLFLNNNKPKKIQNTRRRTSPKESGTNTNKPRQKRRLRTLRIRDTILTSYHLKSSALRHALLRSNKRYKPGD